MEGFGAVEVDGTYNFYQKSLQKGKRISKTRKATPDLLNNIQDKENSRNQQNSLGSFETGLKNLKIDDGKEEKLSIECGKEKKDDLTDLENIMQTLTDEYVEKNGSPPTEAMLSQWRSTLSSSSLNELFAPQPTKS